MNKRMHFKATSTVSPTLLIRIFIISSMIMIGLTSCDLLTNDKDDKEDTLYVQFSNSSSSLYTITNIQLMAMGVAGETPDPSGEWSENILDAGDKIAPGEFKYFTLDIPTSHWSAYRLGIDDGQGNEIMLHLQQNYPGDSYPSITHWGGDDRSVSVTIIYDQSSGNIYISSWSDWVGIEE